MRPHFRNYCFGLGNYNLQKKANPNLILELNDENLGDDEDWAEVVGGRPPWLTGSAGGANK